MAEVPLLNVFIIGFPASLFIQCFYIIALASLVATLSPCQSVHETNFNFLQNGWLLGMLVHLLALLFSINSNSLDNPLFLSSKPKYYIMEESDASKESLAVNTKKASMAFLELCQPVCYVTIEHFFYKVARF